ncbi:MAG: glycyl-radical enzyme activating protein [Lachnospiraceae bacterium]|nr:glycyl-radical enzyme activating protein [Lachnospiraceae bacterium]
MQLDTNYLQTTGRIFDIQKFSIHDGPGIRTIVFLKGCAFRCRWCCNPESQRYEIHPMRVEGKEKTIGKDVTVQEVMEEVLKDLPHYRRSGGGMTLSGGECLLQPQFASDLLFAAKQAGINTAIESTAFADFSMIEEKILPHLDWFLMDVKHMNPNKHKLFIGKSNEKVLENARKIAATGQKLIIRVPVVPTFNDTEAEILEIARFARSLQGVDSLHLLPYHRLGQDKYAGLSREYLLEDIEPPTNEHMQQLLEVAKTTGLHVQIGG